MKAALLNLFIMPAGVSRLVSLSLLSLILFYSPLPPFSSPLHGDRDQFPGQRRGGGTHWTLPLDRVA
ncbi:MAG: hypothetical protein HC929_03205 [Leptolyngbyaceae cyanobacterium SM2_5_2]|nr:hypothetical protein [Leptolyngbyaceae cyanobacterium SM2_5_2]